MTVLIIDSNPTSAPPPIPAPTTGPEFHPNAVYRINIDNNADNQPDVAFTFTFSEYENGTQTGTAWYATGSQARQPEPAGEQLTDSLPVSFDGTARPVQAGTIRLSAALRSDPFFADVEGALHGFAWTGHDDFADNNVDSIALEVPSDILGDGPEIGVWATISLRRDGTLVQLDRGGNPTINPFINPDGEKNLYNSRQPVDDVANYLGPWSKILENGGYSAEAARAAALHWHGRAARSLGSYGCGPRPRSILTRTCSVNGACGPTARRTWSAKAGRRSGAGRAGVPARSRGRRRGARRRARRCSRSWLRAGHLPLGGRAVHRAAAQVPPAAGPLGDAWPHPRGLPQPRLRHHLLAPAQPLTLLKRLSAV